MEKPRYPCLYQINTRVWLTELSQTLGRTATLDDIPDAELDRLASTGFDWIWLLSVWRTGLAAQQVSLMNSEWRHEFQETLPGPERERYRRLGFRDLRLHCASKPRGQRCAGACAAAPTRSRPATDARLRAQPHSTGSSLGGGTP